MKNENTKLLEQVGVVNLSVTGKFIAHDHFTTGSKEAKIARIWCNFKKNFLSKEEAQAEITLRISKLKKNSLDKPIRDELGSKAETTPADISKLIKKQLNGESGKLLTNGCANIFYAREAKGVFLAAIVCWSGSNWCIRTYSLEEPNKRYKGCQVFSR